MLMVSFPGSRVLFGEVIHHFISLDRLQFYYYHNREKGYYDEIFQYKLKELLDMKGLLVQNYLKENIPLFTNEENILSSLDQKQPYTDDAFLKKSKEGSGFIANSKTVILFSFPSILSIQILMAFIYVLLSKSRVSFFLKKYSLFGVTLLFLTEGNI